MSKQDGKPVAKELEETTQSLLDKIKAYLIEKGEWVEPGEDRKDG